MRTELEPVQARSILYMAILSVLFWHLRNIGASWPFDAQQRLIAALGCILVSIVLITSLRTAHRVDGYAIFVALGFFFFFGQQFLILTNLAPRNMMLYSGEVSDAAIYETGFLILWSLAVMHVGYSFIRRDPAPLDMEWNEILPNDKAKLMTACETIAVLVLLPTLYTLLRNVYLYMTVGYGERMLNTRYMRSGLENLPSILSSYMMPSLLGAFLAKETRERWPVAAILAYLSIYLLSGSRISAFCAIIGIFYIQSLKGTFRCRALVRKTALLAAMLIAFSVISNVRGLMSWKNLTYQSALEEYVENEDNNAIVQSIQEAGFTFYAIAAVVDHCPSDEPYIKGLSYLSGVAYILPNGLTGNIYGKVKGVDATFQRYIYDGGSGIGSSFIAEAYYNFGYFGLILIFFYGIGFALLCRGLERSFEDGAYRRAFLLMGIYVIIVFYIRSDTRTFFRNFVWYYVAIWSFSYTQRPYSGVEEQQDPHSLCGDGR